jgi:hypothetical protein
MTEQTYTVVTFSEQIHGGEWDPTFSEDFAVTECEGMPDVIEALAEHAAGVSEDDPRRINVGQTISGWDGDNDSPYDEPTALVFVGQPISVAEHIGEIQAQARAIQERRAEAKRMADAAEHDERVAASRERERKELERLLAKREAGNL